MVDFHSHILPCLDDGADSVETAISMIKLNKIQEVNTIVASPHFYPGRMDIDAALEKRKAAFESLVVYAKSIGFELPEIILGFEVTVDKALKNMDISKLCIGNSKVILLEMPHLKWKNEHFEVLRYIEKQGYFIIMAHVERYIGRVPDNMHTEMINMGFCNQINSKAFIKPKINLIVSEMIKDRRLHIIGSDAHNTSTRCSLLDVAEHYIKTKLGDEWLDYIAGNEDYVLKLIKGEV